MEAQIIYLPIGVPTFDLELAGALFRKCGMMLHKVAGDCGVDKSQLALPKEPLLSIDALEAFMDEADARRAPDTEPALVIAQNTTFANGAYMDAILDRYDAPILLWTLKDPAPDGGRLKLNSLTGAYSAGNRFAMRERRGLSYVYGETSREPVQQQVKTVIRAALCRAALRGAKLGNVGDAPQGFEFGNVADDELLRVFGMTQERVPVEQLMEKAATCPESEMRKRLDEAREVFVGFDAIPQENREGYARLMWAYEDYVVESGVVAVASRCWPDFFTRYGTPVCAVLSLLNDRGIPAACEGDSAGALTMLIGSFLSGQSVFFGDPCAIDTNKDTVTFWHCGMAAPSLASPTTGACVGVHPNRRIGPVMDFGCKESLSVTIFRIGHKPGGGLRMFLASGSTFESPEHYEGTNLVVHWDGDVRRMVEDSIHSGWEPHFVVAYGWIYPELIILADWLGIPVERY